MKQIFDEDSVTTLKQEERVYGVWEKEKKNHILSIFNPTRRMEEWKKHFGVKQEPNDQYLLGNIF